jgi:parvulin-like peptidyl-prolyl isomerase
MTPLIFCLFLAFDELACVVDREPITKEEIKYISIFYPGTSYYDMVDRIINNKIMENLAEAETLKVSDEEIAAMKEEILANNPGLASMIEDDYLDKLYTDQIRIQIYSNKLLGTKFRDKLKVSPTEVQNFYQNHKDSLILPETVTFEKIQIPVLPPENNPLRDKAQKILDEYKNGADFTSLVKKYSEDILTVPYGGKLGKLSPDEIPPHLAGLLELGEGEAGIFESPSGYHIIKVEKREGIDLILSQILLQFKFKEGEIKSAEKRALGIKKQWETGDSTLADKIETIGPLPIQALPEGLVSLIDKLEVSEISDPLLEGMSFHLIKIKERQKNRTPELSEIKDRLSGLLVQQKMVKLIEELLEKERKHIFIKKI